MATVVQTIVLTCVSTAERTAFIAQINAWSVANPGQIVSITTGSGNKLTVVCSTITAVPN